MRSLSACVKDAQMCLKRDDAVRVFFLHLRFTFRVSLNFNKPPWEVARNNPLNR